MGLEVLRNECGARLITDDMEALLECDVCPQHHIFVNEPIAPMTVERDEAKELIR